MSNTTYQRIGDTMAIVAIELTPAVIDWQDILDCIKIEPDDDYCETHGITAKDMNTILLAMLARQNKKATRHSSTNISGEPSKWNSTNANLTGTENGAQASRWPAN